MDFGDSGGSSLVCELPRTHRYWWTCAPVMPRTRISIGYRTLRRQWADHTMNTFRIDGANIRPNSRGFYTETREDHIATVLFHIFGMFEGSRWAADLLGLWNLPYEGEIEAVRWSYSFEETLDQHDRVPGLKPIPIADIVFSWMDADGEAIAVIETKKPGGRISSKDKRPDLYLKLPSIKKISRKFKVFLICQSDLTQFRDMLPHGSRIATWQQVADLQAQLAAQIPVPRNLAGVLSRYALAHYADLGVVVGQQPMLKIDHSPFDGTVARYDSIRALSLAPSVEDFLIGSEAAFCARAGLMPTAPYPWLAEEPSCLDVWRRGKSGAPLLPTSRYSEPLWKISR